MQKIALVLAILATGFCGMIAEYSVSTMVGYMIGNSVGAFTVIISTFMLAMGAGGYFSQRVSRNELGVFVVIEILLSLISGASPVLISLASRIDFTWEAALFSAAAVGALIGFEIPLLMRINEDRKLVLKKNVALVFGLDYFGSFIAGATFSTILLPRLGVVMTPVLGGVTNFFIAVMVVIVFRESIFGQTRFGLVAVSTFAIAAAAILGALSFKGESMVFAAEQAGYQDPIIFSKQTAYQRIVITEDDGSLCLYLNGNTQFCLSDEARYHEPLVQPAMFVTSSRHERVLILGGGDGMALREVEKHGDVKEIVLVDLDPGMVELCRTYPALRTANNFSFEDPRVRVVNDDAFSWVRKHSSKWDVIIVDLPDPSTPELAKLYSLEFYQAIASLLEVHGALVVQSTSPYHARETFVTIKKTVEAARLSVVPYRSNVPSFGDWGFCLAMHDRFLGADALRRKLDTFEPQVATRFLNQDVMQASLRWEKGIWEDESRFVVSRLVRPTVQLEYEKAWDEE